MYKKGLLILSGIFFIAAECVSQHLSHQVLVSGAGISYGSGINYSQTLGEPVVGIAGAYDRILTQGFQQPRIRLNDAKIHQGTGVNVYPNPVIYNVNIELFGEVPRRFVISIINIVGTIVYSNEMEFSDRYWEVMDIQLTHLSRGFYFVRVLSTDGVINRTFKIEKM